MKRSPTLIKEFNKRYNAWKQKTSPLGKYAKPHRYNDKTANQIEDIIIAYFEIKGLVCWKIDVQGTLREQNGRTFYAPTKCSKGVSDLFVIVNGAYLAIEVKAGKDVQSDYQKRFEKDVKNQGGHYMIVHHFADFLYKYNAWYASVFKKNI